MISKSKGVVETLGEEYLEADGCAARVSGTVVCEMLKQIFLYISILIQLFQLKSSVYFDTSFWVIFDSLNTCDSEEEGLFFLTLTDFLLIWV